VLLQVLPLAQESGEGIPTDKVEQQGNETTLGGVGARGTTMNSNTQQPAR